jgi:hypothetical protein
MDQVLIKGATALGKRVSTRVVRQVSELVGKVSELKPEHREQAREVAGHGGADPAPAATTPEATRSPAKDMTQLDLFDPEKKD